MVLAALALLVPLAGLAILLAEPRLNHHLLRPVPHFFVVTNVAVVAAAVALLVARAALRLEQHTVLLIAVGFMALASLFAVHAISTPGVMGAVLSSGTYDYETALGAGYSGTVIGLSAYLSLFIPALLFAASYSSATSRVLPRLPDLGLVAVVGALLLIYAGFAILHPGFALTALSREPYSYVLATISVGLFGFAAWRQMQTYARTRLPTHGALVVAFVLLAEAQVIMVIAEFWTLAWWEYHLLMLAAVTLALGALFLELDRRRGLERFLPAEVVERVVAGDLLRLTGERRTVTVLFADLRGSTQLAERLSAEDVVRLINEYVGVLAGCVFAHGGMLDKFLGDGLMAVFGIVPDATDGAAPAARAALAMRREIQRVNDARQARGEPPVGFGVGLNTGEVVLGAIGIPQRSDFTAIGDTVNTASRLQEFTKTLNVEIVLSESTAERLATRDGMRLRELQTVTVRGRSAPVRILTLE